MIQYRKAEHFILEKLKAELPSNLTYHCLNHSLDVLQASMKIAKAEQLDKEEKKLLRLAALFHDSGFINVYHHHEEQSCELAKKYLPQFGVHEQDLKRICGMIMSTQLPQQAHSLPEKIIADADLDYLGRKDFYPIAKTLFQEWKNYGLVKDENDWNLKQIKFLESHHYCTATSQKLRAARKAKHLEEIKQAYNDSH